MKSKSTLFTKYFSGAHYSKTNKDLYNLSTNVIMSKTIFLLADVSNHPYFPITCQQLFPSPNNWLWIKLVKTSRFLYSSLSRVVCCRCECSLTYTGLPIRVKRKLHVAGTSGPVVHLLTDVLTATVTIVTRH